MHAQAGLYNDVNLLRPAGLVPRPFPVEKKRFGKGGLGTLVDFLGTASTIWEGPIRLQDFACHARVM